MRMVARGLLAGAAIVGAVVIAGCSRPSAAKLNDDGNQAFVQGDYPTALEDYLEAEVQRPDLPALNYNAGNVLHAQGQYERGITESLRATQTGPADVRVRAYYTIGADYYREGQLKEALDAYKNALRLDPSDLDAKYNVEVIQRRLDKEAAQQQQQQADQNGGQNQQNQQSQQQQQGQQGQQNQQSGQGQTQQDPNAQQPASGQQGQQAQQAQQTGGSPGTQPQGQAGGTQSSGGGAQAGAVDPNANAQAVRAQLGQLQQALRDAQNAYQSAPSIEGALQILDILAQQEALTQADRANRTDPHTPDK